MTRFEFELPDPGEGLTEAEIAEWFVEEGDEVDEDDVLGEIETDKAVTELPAPCPGTIEELRASEGDVVAVGDVVVVFETDSPPSEGSGSVVESEAEAEGESEAEAAGEAEGEAEAEAEPESEAAEEGEGEAEAEGETGEEAQAGAAQATAGGEETTESVTADGEPDTAEGRVFAAPYTRRMAREEGVDLSDVDGSGPDGRVLREDVEAHLEGEPAASGEAANVLAHPTVDVEPTSIEERDDQERRDLSGLRGRIAENMVESKTVVPHLTSGFEADAGELVELKERIDEKHDVHVTNTPILLKAVVPALKEYPIVNASVDDETGEIVEKHYYDVGFATHTEDGLVVPVIEDVDSKSIVDVAREMNDLAEQARERSIDAADLKGGTFTVTNLALEGEHRTFGTPIINHPEAAIMGVGPIDKKPVVTDDDEIVARHRVPLTLSYDHRLVDGVTANRFMEHVIEGIEDTDVLLSRL